MTHYIGAKETLQSLHLNGLSWHNPSYQSLCYQSYQNPPVAKQNLGLYTSLEEGMGMFFFLFISSSQITWILYIFQSVSMLTSGLSELMDFVTFLSSFISAIATMLMAISFIFCLSDCHKSLETLEESLADDIIEMAPGRERYKAELLLKVGVKCHDLLSNISTQKLEKLGPLTGLGLFRIERNTITSMVSVAVTYIIILIQFKMTVEAN